MAVTYLQPLGGKTAHPRAAIKGHTVLFPIAMEENLKVVSDAHKGRTVRLPILNYNTIIVDRLSQNSDKARSYFIKRQPVSDAIECLRRINPSYQNVINTWLQEQDPVQQLLAEMELPDKVLKTSPDTLNILQLGLTINKELKANLEHKGNTSNMEISASSVVQTIAASKKTDLEIFNEKRIEAIPLSSFDRDMETMPYPELYPSGKYGLNHPRRRKINEAEFVKHNLRLYDGRFAESTEYKFKICPN